MPLALPLRYQVLECAIEHGDELKLPLDSCIEGPTLPMLSCVLWPEDMRNFVPHSTLGGVWGPKQCRRSPNLEESSASPSRALLD